MKTHDPLYVPTVTVHTSSCDVAVGGGGNSSRQRTFLPGLRLIDLPNPAGACGGALLTNLDVPQNFSTSCHLRSGDASDHQSGACRLRAPMHSLFTPALHNEFLCLANKASNR
jgi:hypothetical protein